MNNLTKTEAIREMRHEEEATIKALDFWRNPPAFLAGDEWVRIHLESLEMGLSSLRGFIKKAEDSDA
jgi:hypothetical protein